VEQKAASDRLLAALRSEWRVPAALQRLYADTAWLQQLVAEELRPRPGRIRTSVRMAFISAVGAALMAALHINSVLGPDTLWVALYASNSLMTAGAGLVMVMAAGALGRVDSVCCGTLGAPSTGSARSVRSRCDGLRCAARVFGNRCSHRSDPPTAHQTKIFIGYAGYRSDGGLRGGHSSTRICAKCFLGRRSYGGRRHCLDRAHVQLQRRSSNRGPGTGQSPRPGGLPSRVSGWHGRWKHPLGCARYSNGGQSGSVGCGLRLNSEVDAYHSL
jgi:hypothetical protein